MICLLHAVSDVCLSLEHEAVQSSPSVSDVERIRARALIPGAPNLFGAPRHQAPCRSRLSGRRAFHVRVT
jgi:hypothetical protein